MSHKATRKLLLIVILLLIVTMTVALWSIRHPRKQPHPGQVKVLPVKGNLHSWWPIGKKTIHWKLITIKSGDSLAKIFSKLRIPYNELEQILRLQAAKQHLTHLKPGQKLYFDLSITPNKQNHINEIKFSISSSKTLYIKKQGKKFTATLISEPMTATLEFKSGVIHHSLAVAARRAGLTRRLYSELLSIFQGDINYSRNLRSGDHFAILYKEYYVDGKKDHPGHIVAADFTNHGKTYRAVRFTYPKDHTAYYTPAGRGIKPLFIIPPIKYKFISSGFQYHRLDPVTHTYRPHLGIDYAANYGTPIRSIGEGKVIFANKHEGYGNAVEVRYDHKYKALYAHMEHIARNIHSGEEVKQGEVLGYVGSTGWSTGPHLHFEMYVYGIPRNPLNMKFPNGKPIPKSYEAKFLQRAKSLLANLNLHEQSDRASNSTR